jgi:hypothetical protein
LNSRETVEARALIRTAGKWSVWLGPTGFLGRLVKRDPEDPFLERRLGLLASCTGALTLSALESSGILTHGVRVTAQSARVSPDCPERARLTIFIECETDDRMAQACIDAKVRSHGLISSLGFDLAALEVKVETCSGLHGRMP